ncbi:MAG: universal stress protein [Methanocellales archaeon]|nr:universal stress protein [Methanocellales archaeon]
MKHILACTAGSEPALAVVRCVIKVVKTFDAKMTVLHLLPRFSLVSSEELEREGKKALKIFVDAAEKAGLKVDTLLESAEDVAQGIVEVASRIKADLIVVGAGERPSWYSFPKKDVIGAVMYTADCPVLVLPRVLKRSVFGAAQMTIILS